MKFFFLSRKICKGPLTHLLTYPPYGKPCRALLCANKAHTWFFLFSSYSNCVYFQENPVYICESNLTFRGRRDIPRFLRQPLHSSSTSCIVARFFKLCKSEFSSLLSRNRAPFDRTRHYFLTLAENQILGKNRAVGANRSSMPRNFRLFSPNLFSTFTSLSNLLFQLIE